MVPPGDGSAGVDIVQVITQGGGGGPVAGSCWYVRQEVGRARLVGWAWPRPPLSRASGRGQEEPSPFNYYLLPHSKEGT